MKAYRYDCENRNHRDFNQCGEEKNPNMVKFYAKSLEYAENYKYIYDDRGYEVEECILTTVEVSSNLFDMEANFSQLSTYQNYVNEYIEMCRKEYEYHISRFTKKADIKRFQGFLKDLENEEKNIISRLRHNQFQTLSDFARQNELVAELKSLGFEGYETSKEIAIF